LNHVPSPTHRIPRRDLPRHFAGRPARTTFDDDPDRQAFLEVVGAALDRFDICALAYCLMGNHGIACNFS